MYVEFDIESPQEMASLNQINRYCFLHWKVYVRFQYQVSACRMIFEFSKKWTLFSWRRWINFWFGVESTFRNPISFLCTVQSLVALILGCHWLLRTTTVFKAWLQTFVDSWLLPFFIFSKPRQKWMPKHKEN